MNRSSISLPLVFVTGLISTLLLLSGCAIIPAAVAVGSVVAGETLSSNAGKHERPAHLLYQEAYWDRASEVEVPTFTGKDAWVCAPRVSAGRICIEPATYERLNTLHKTNPKRLETELATMSMSCQYGKGGGYSRMLVTSDYNSWLFCKKWST
jgi:hypothetical protein